MVGPITFAFLGAALLFFGASAQSTDDEMQKAFEPEVLKLSSQDREDLRPGQPMQLKDLSDIAIYNKPFPLKTTCVYSDIMVPCYYYQLDDGNDVIAAVEEINVFGKLYRDLPENTWGSTHEIVLVPHNMNNKRITMGAPHRFAVSQQLMSAIGFFKYSDGSYNQRILTQADIQTGYILLSETNLATAPQSNPYAPIIDPENTGLHSIVFSKTEEGLSTGTVYLVLEFIDSIAEAHLEFKNSGDAKPILTIRKVWNIPCKDWSMQMVDDKVPTGNFSVCAAPHTLAEDALGNLYIAMKLGGGMAVLKNPLKEDNSASTGKWSHFLIPCPGSGSNTVRDPTKSCDATTRFGAKSTPLPFYVAAASNDVWFNSVTTSEVGVYQNAGVWPPSKPDMVALKPEGGDGGIYANAPTNMRPGGIVALNGDGGGSLSTLYNSFMAVTYVDPKTLQPTILHVYDERVFLKQHADGIGLAFLHLCMKDDDQYDDEVAGNLYLIASSNDFPATDVFDEAPASMRPPAMPDMLVVFKQARPTQSVAAQCHAATDEEDCDLRSGDDGACYWQADDDVDDGGEENGLCVTVLIHEGVEVFMAPSQNTWFHRVSCESASGVVFVTELKADRLFVVNQLRGDPSSSTTGSPTTAPSPDNSCQHFQHAADCKHHRSDCKWLKKKKLCIKAREVSSSMKIIMKKSIASTKAADTAKSLIAQSSGSVEEVIGRRSGGLRQRAQQQQILDPRIL